MFYNQIAFSLTDHKFQIVATDGGGRSSQVPVVVHLEDVNDLPPKFKKRVYQGFMTPDMSRFFCHFLFYLEGSSQTLNPIFPLAYDNSKTQIIKVLGPCSFCSC